MCVFKKYECIFRIKGKSIIFSLFYPGNSYYFTSFFITRYISSLYCFLSPFIVGACVYSITSSLTFGFLLQLLILRFSNYCGEYYIHFLFLYTHNLFFLYLTFLLINIFYFWTHIYNIFLLKGVGKP